MGNQPDLIQRIQRNEPSAFGDVVAWYSEDVLRLCYLLLCNRQDAEDVLQETLLKLIRMAKSGKVRSGNGSLKGLLLTIARNLCIDRLRKKINPISLTDEDDELQIPDESTDAPDAQLDGQRFERALQDALDQLKEIPRAVFVLHELQQEPYDRIALSLGLTVDAVRQHLYRARRELIRRLERYV